MKEYEVNVLEQYDIEVNGTRRTRGAVLCDTDRGVLLLKEAGIAGKRVPLLYKLCENLEKSGYPNVDQIIKNQEEEYISEAEDGTRYMLTRWFNGRECDVRREGEILEAVRNLAKLHKMMCYEEEEDWDDVRGESVLNEYERHNRELKKVRSFVRKKSLKGEFEAAFLKCFDVMYEWAVWASEQMAASSYEELYQESLRRRTIVHGDYNYHNVLMVPGGIATTNFGHYRVDVQMSDFYYFLRKILEKTNWDEQLGRAMLHAYHRIKPISEAEEEYLCLRLSYPEKFWKIANSYYHSNKAWVPAKNIEKLQKEIVGMEEKRRFLEHIFPFHFLECKV